MPLLSIILIAVAAWLAVLMFVLALLRMASNADDALDAARQREGIAATATDEEPLGASGMSGQTAGGIVMPTPSHDERLDPAAGAVLARVIEFAFTRDRASGRHAVAVAHYARQLAMAIGLPDAEQVSIHTAGLLHDLDHQTVADTLTSHACELDPAARRLVERLATVGAHVLHELPGLGPVADIVTACHEHVDGSGHPRERRAEQIPRGARIVAIAEAYDALTAPDAQGTSISPTGAVDELQRMAGHQLDRALVHVFLTRVLDTAADEPAPLSTPLRDHLRPLHHSAPFAW